MGKSVGPALHLVAVTLFSVLAGAAPVSASVVKDTAAADPFLGAAGGSVESDTAACTASQCSLAVVKSAAHAIAMSAGAKPAPALDNASMFPESSHKTLGYVSTTSLATSRSADIEPVLFAVILPSSERSQLCIEEGNLLGMQPNCTPAPNAQGSNLGYDCQNTDPRFGMKIACRIAGEVPEPGTLLLLGIGLLGLGAARARRILRQRSAASR